MGDQLDVPEGARSKLAVPAQKPRVFQQVGRFGQFSESRAL